ncbi:PLP-dependent aminotransferase family protein [Bradyrhizobium uaiense]|uniref:PLP-dependent aminotransferase family protein n=1 Tax=Bradyrhizobium uaiense TaxID=2594946 RepID=A0A6P1BM52_9BRAD|nr:PLP-dependent aminotransferase family protein [Bradyrhizobium uaiense]NEU99597.1 PLP-dependent aminotransferase family protein [Bradyrhizobium uaiense]
MPKTAVTGTIISLGIDKASHVPIYRQISDRLREAVSQGRIIAGTKLPSTRIMADELGVSRNTVLQVFDTLINEGLLASRVGDGTYVTDDVQKQDGMGPHSSIQETAASNYPFRSISRRGRNLVASASDAFSESPTPFMPDLPDLREFPIRTWLRLLNETSGRLRGEILAETSNAGYEPLRRAIAQYLNASRGMACEFNQVIITTGTQQSLDLVSRILLDPGDPVWLEEPGFVGARAAFSANGASLYPATVDEQGICIAAAIRTLPSPRVVFASTSRQYPLGATLSLERRKALVEFAAHSGSWIVEDDYDHEFRYSGNALPAIHGLDQANRTIHLGTFSKILLPTLRLGYIVVPPDLADAFAKARTIVDRHASLIEQMVLSEFLSRGLLVSHVRRMRTLYRARQKQLVEGLNELLGQSVPFEALETGMHLVLPLSSTADDQALSDMAAQKTIVLRPLSPYYLGRKRRKGLLFGFSAFNSDEIRQGLQRLLSLRREITPLVPRANHGTSYEL